MASGREGVEVETIGYVEHAALGHTWVVTHGAYRRCSECEIEKIAKEPDGLGDFCSYGTFTIGGVLWTWQFKDGRLTEKQVDRQMKFYSAVARGEKVVYHADFWTRFKNWFLKLHRSA